MSAMVLQHVSIGSTGENTGVNWISQRCSLADLIMFTVKVQTLLNLIPS
jgi:hypothetical protein